MSSPRTVAFHTLGCKLNYSETSSIGRLFEEAGYSEVPFEQGADVYVVNTCSVTDFADRKCRQIVRRALKYAPEAKMVVVGAAAAQQERAVAVALEVVATGQTKEMDPAAPSTQAVEAAGEVNTTTRQQAVTAVRESSFCKSPTPTQPPFLVGSLLQ